MKFKLQLQILADDNGIEHTQEIATFDKEYARLADLGLKLTESKRLLAELQRQLIEQQISAYLSAHRDCSHCGKKLAIKDYAGVNFRSLFGTVVLRSPRLHQCACQPHRQKTFSPLNELLPELTAPELLYLETKWASLMAYNVTAERLKDLLPVDDTLNAETIRQHLHKIAERDEAALGKEQFTYIEGCPAQWAQWSRPDGPITVGIDGGYIRNWENKKTHFEVIVGKSLPRESADKYFDFVQAYDEKPKRRLFEVLKSQGMQENQLITFLTDGGETVRDLPQYLNPESEHLLDWFHITMRLTVLGQYAKGVTKFDAEQGEIMTKYLDSIKWYLWHGNVYEALEEIEDLDWQAEALELDYEHLGKLAKAVREFRIYIEQNGGYIPNYGERWRNGERISTAFVESSVNAVIGKRFAKKQQMQWSHKGAHLLLQVRARVLNGELKTRFAEWYPGFDCHDETDKLKQAA